MVCALDYAIHPHLPLARARDVYSLALLRVNEYRRFHISQPFFNSSNQGKWVFFPISESKDIPDFKAGNFVNIHDVGFLAQSIPWCPSISSIVLIMPIN